MVKCLNIGKNIGKPIYRSISIRYTHPPKPHSHPGHGTNVTPPTRVRTSSPSVSRTRDSGAGGGRSNKERQRLQPLASVARAPLLRSGEWGLHTALTGIHPLHCHVNSFLISNKYNNFWSTHINCMLKITYRLKPRPFQDNPTHFQVKSCTLPG